MNIDKNELKAGALILMDILCEPPEAPQRITVEAKLLFSKILFAGLENEQTIWFAQHHTRLRDPATGAEYFSFDECGVSEIVTGLQVASGDIEDSKFHAFATLESHTDESIKHALDKAVEKWGITANTIQ